MSGPRQALLHREAWRTLSARPGSDPLLVAHHARAAGDPDAAAAALAAGGAAAARRFDLGEAERLLTEALALAPSGDLLVRRGRIRLARADLDGAEADAVAAVAEAGATALELRAWVARLRHDMDTALRVGAEAAERAEDPATRTSARLAVAFAHRGLGDLAAAERELLAAIDTEGSDRLGAKGWLGVLRVHQGRPDQALDLLEPAIGAEVDAVHGFWVEHTLQMAVHAYAMTGRVVEARALLDRLDRELDRRGSRDRYRGPGGELPGLDPAEPRRSPRPRRRRSRPSTRRPWRSRAPRRRSTSPTDTSAAATTSGPAGCSTRPRRRCTSAGSRTAGGARPASGCCGRTSGWPATSRRPPSRCADEVAATAAARGDDRYALLARLAAARGRWRRAGGAVDLDAVDADLARLPRVAGLEAWWTTALVARDLGVDAWRGRAEAAVDALALGVGVDAEGFRERAGRWLDERALRAPGPRGGRPPAGRAP